MQWVRIDRMNWKCTDYKHNFEMEVKPNKKSFSWIVNRDGKKIDSGRHDNALDAIHHAVASVNKHTYNN